MKRGTKESILDAAEALFAERGFDATSLRAITSAARVNLAAVNYHFGSREALIEAVLARRVEPMNEQRLQRLSDLQAHYGTAAVPLRELIRAFVAPALELSHDRSHGGQRFIRLIGRSLSEPAGIVHDCLRGHYEAVSERFKPAFARTLSHLPAQELYWRMHFMVGLLAYLMAGADIMRLIASSRLSGPPDGRTALAQLVEFVHAGMSAPAGVESATVAAAERAAGSGS